jgi:small subunit ribosomal protein S20
MANTSSAKKAIRASAKKAVTNVAHRKAYRDARKQVVKNIGSDKAAELLKGFYKEVDKAAKTHAISKNAAARYKSRLTKLANSK